ncbi:hypothetical protein [Methylophilus sp.]|jgi:hypothetical protein|uniref:hypothetical protein n=1 Tax=Methylophilus sp. TaxID=29541 RepID=UPI0011DA29CA|nr:hypothetical protein [Methylophilus sp.]TXI47536.1 MAG: hypothetical protein E6Q52_00795 [Methylophilus sp.]
MREYSTIRDAIKSLGATVAEEHLQPEFFGGSAYCVFNANQGSQFRLVWDGKEGYGFLQSATSPEQWQDIGPHLSGVANPQAPKFVELLSIAKALINGTTTV